MVFRSSNQSLLRPAFEIINENSLLIHHTSVSVHNLLERLNLADNSKSLRCTAIYRPLFAGSEDGDRRAPAEEVQIAGHEGRVDNGQRLAVLERDNVFSLVRAHSCELHF